MKDHLNLVIKITATINNNNNNNNNKTIFIHYVLMIK